MINVINIMIVFMQFNIVNSCVLFTIVIYIRFSTINIIISSSTTTSFVITFIIGVSIATTTTTTISAAAAATTASSSTSSITIIVVTVVVSRLIAAWIVVAINRTFGTIIWNITMRFDKKREKVLNKFRYLSETFDISIEPFK